MPRIIKLDKKEPYLIEIENKKVWVCGCGLSSKKPYCDGSHKLAKDEDDNKLYLYNEQKERRIVKEIKFEE
jgi:CDGSH-type Zn-finger protein